MKPTLEQLKASAYDCIAQIEIWQKRLGEANHMIANFKEEVAPEVKEEVKDEEVKGE